MKCPEHFPALIAAGVLLNSCGKDRPAITMELLPTGTVHELREILFTSPLKGYAAGGDRYEEGVVLVTADGGDTWARKAISDKMIFGLAEASEDTVFGVGQDGKIYRTADGGITWEIIQTPEWKLLHAMCFASPLSGIAVGGEGYGDGIIHHTSDGGITWKGDTLDNELRDVFFTSALIGYAAGYGIILRTADGGNSWQTTSAEGDFFTTLHFPSPLTGFAAGFNGTIMKTTDGGASWRRQRNGNNLLIKQARIESIRFADDRTGYAVGRDGLVLVTDDGGETWNLAKHDAEEDFFDIWLTGPMGGFIAGSNGVIYRFSR